MYSGKMVVFGQMFVVFRQKLFYFGKSDCIREKVVVFLQKGYIRAKWLYSGKVVVLGKNCCIRAKLFLSGKSCCIREKLGYSGKMVVFCQKSLYSGKVVVFGRKWLYSGKVDLFWQNWLYSGKIGYIPRKVVVFGQKVVVILQSGCILAGFFVFGQKWLY